MDQLVSFLPLILVVLVFWLLVIRPASKRQRDLRQLQAALEAGDRVMLSAGIHGVVRGTEEDRVLVEIADGVVIEVARAGIATRLSTESHSSAGELPPDDMPPTHNGS